MHLLVFLELPHSLVNDLELIGPVSCIEPGSHVITIVVAAFRVEEESRR